jgi:uncharacterized protein YndB with AHSA1/START domain
MSDHRETAVEVTVAAPLEVVWRALRDRAELRRWHGWEYEQLDAEIETIYYTEATVDEERHVLSTGASVIELESAGPATVVRVVMAAPPDDPTWQGYYEDIKQGWLTFVQQLRFALERHPGQDRATVYVSGLPRKADQPPVTELLGLAAGLPGERYSATVATGDELAGEVWFRDAYQLGVTVDGWGDGLLVVTDRWSPAGAAGAVLTAYGLDPDAVVALGDRWAAWWADRFRSGDEAVPAAGTP